MGRGFGGLEWSSAYFHTDAFTIMADRQRVPDELTWYQEQWEELLDLLPTSNAEEVVPYVRELQVRALGEPEDALEDVGLTADTDPETVLRKIFGRLQALRRENQAFQRLHNLLSTESPDELVDAVDDLIEKIDTYHEEKTRLTEAGFSGPYHVLRALERMEEQLQELYTEKEAAEQAPRTEGPEREGDTFDQIQSLIAREKKLQREIGVSDPDAVVEMVHGLADQLDELYSDRDTDGEQEPGRESSVQRLHGTDLLENAVGSTDPKTIAHMVTNLTDQLEDVYAERERLAELDVHGPEEAVQMVETMQHQLESMYERREQMTDHGIEDLDEASSMIENMDAQLEEAYATHELDSTSGTEIDEQPILPGDEERELSELNEEDLEALPAGLLALDEDGIVRRANQRALHWPDAPGEDPADLIGRNFFTSVAPGTNNTFFRGRFFDGIDEGKVDDLFSYTYVSDEASPTNLRVQFYSTSNDRLYWIAFQVLEQY